ncbi:MAG: hypothetical protein HQ534_03260 [Armatimonadetes bacterium]|nr:hypothetical protein [Armatimonadota bacterium]
MNRNNLKIIIMIVLLFILCIIPDSAYCQNDLSKFEKFVGKKWIGHFQNSEDSLLVHTIEWEYDLNNNVVIEIKSVPEVDFYCETYYYWDFEPDQISYLSLMNKKMISKGMAIFDNGKLKLSGKTFFPDGVQENKKTYVINEARKLEDRFYRKSKSKWIMGHFIQYSEQ